MAKRSTRQQALEQIDRIIQSLEKAEGIAAGVGITYDAANSECAAIMLIVIQSVDVVKPLLIKLKQEL